MYIGTPLCRTAVTSSTKRNVRAFSNKVLTSKVATIEMLSGLSREVNLYSSALSLPILIVLLLYTIGEVRDGKIVLLGAYHYSAEHSRGSEAL